MKTKNIIIALTFGFAIAFSPACKKYLDIIPKGYVIPKKMEDFERILNDQQLFRFLTTNMETVADDYYDNTYEKSKPNITTDARLYLWQPDVYIEAGEIQASPWNTLYTSVYQFNAIINGAPKAEDATPERLTKLLAKAKFGRAVCFYYLLNFYSKPYQKATANQDMGIPLVQSNSITDELPGRGTIQESYDFIINDLKEASVNAPEVADNTFLITKAAAFGFLARSYLMMQDYQNAAIAADKALSYKATLLDYNDIYEDKTDANTGVDYTGIKQGETVFSNRLTFPENIFSFTFSYVGGMFGEPIAKSTVNLIDSVTDLRRIFLYPNYEKPWKGVFSYGESFSQINPGIATPEMYLIKAEGLARTGKIAQAMQALNTLRKNRIRTEYYEDLTAVNEKDAMQKVLTERRAELLFKGHRWFDMRRFKDDPDFATLPRHYFNDGTFITLKPDNPAYILRLPPLAITDKIKQN